MSRPGRAGMIGPLLLWPIAALVIAGIVHIVAVLLLARQGRESAYAVVSALAQGAAGRTVLAPPPDDRRLPFRDPAMALSFCLLDLSDGPVEVALPVTPLDVATLSIQDAGGQALYALTNRSAVRGSLSVTVMTPAMMAAADPDGTREGAIRVALPGGRGFAAAQAIAGMGSQRPEADAAAARLACRPSR